MIKVCSVLHRRPDLGVEEFQAYWRGTHGPLAARLPGLRRYVQSHPLPGGYRKGPLAFDGLAELWFEDRAALVALASTPELAAVKEDEANFLDAPRMAELVMDEVVVKDGPPAPIKSIEVVRFRSDLTPEEGRDYWQHVHGPIAASIPAVRRYVQNRVGGGAYHRPAPPFCDGLAVTWADSVDALRESARSEEYARTRADEANFLAPGDPAWVLATEVVVVD